jgi:branched-chain amino acid transport system permease protein
MFFSDFYLTVMVYMGINIILAFGLNIIMGFAGQVHLGSGTYAAVGAYTTAFLLRHVGVSFWVALPISVFLAGVMGGLTGLPALRVREDFLAITTIALVFVFEIVMSYLPWFGGPVGIDNVARPVLFGTTFSNDHFLVLVLILVVVCVWINIRIIRSWLGIGWECIREGEEAASILGIDVPKYKIFAFIIGGCFLGLGGSLYTSFFRHIAPADFSFIPSIEILTMVMLGGIGTIRGAIIGPILLVAFPELFRFIQDYRNVIYGGILVSIMMFQPTGILGNESYLWKGIRNLKLKQNLKTLASRESKK